jgi:hypothetical protein
MARTIQEAAKWYADRMTVYRRESGEEYHAFRDNLPRAEEETCRALALAAHGDGDMLPNDWRYAFISEALNALAECSDPDDLYLEADIYASALTDWLGSHSSRPGYCDEAAEEYGGDLDRDLVGRIQLGQVQEKTEVLSLVRAHLESELRDAEDDSDAS